MKQRRRVLSAPDGRGASKQMPLTNYERTTTRATKHQYPQSRIALPSPESTQGVDGRCAPSRRCLHRPQSVGPHVPCQHLRAELHLSGLGEERTRGGMQAHAPSRSGHPRRSSPSSGRTAPEAGTTNRHLRWWSHTDLVETVCDWEACNQRPASGIRPIQSAHWCEVLPL